MNYVIGHRYEVPCAEVRWREDRRTYFIPVLGDQHSDPQFGFRESHYHIDGRFYMEPRMLHYFGLQQGRTSAVIVPRSKTGYDFMKIVHRELICTGLMTGLLMPQIPTEDQKIQIGRYEQWYQGFIGKKCEGRKCPHLGTDMNEHHGLLICPLHDLVADIDSLEIIPQKTVR
ncbi:hypothetical protein ACFQZI_06435 [Mucilaginibacter lutimaris]|uniref:Rieske domain-containing protein n=1 Tax=Mucilaginibacter lutimaris TaxID=931629 RepID=A0ABW2ZE68_9SPHI